MAARHLNGIHTASLLPCLVACVAGFLSIALAPATSQEITDIKVPSTELIVPEDTEKPYCTFFNNRKPEFQPNLKNCTWYQDNCCCRQVEIEVAFGKVKPLQGATLPCQKYINYLICYICAPTQYKFYLWQRLTVCEEFCDLIFDRCKDAILKGSAIGELYKNGTNFCKSRRFEVAPYSSGKCFYFNETMDTSSTGSIVVSPAVSSLVWAGLMVLTVLTKI
ncbi:uncharacterized protein LOC119734691 [Patiria miniata]|uniref:Folate receptor-like domain-containing protein n=1 Tax=Patiria miniata TaxID=46514 RepID=A0A914AL41_PATMI|nr:uncharacterized protein LOC119734691 [Patiria miniata]